MMLQFQCKVGIRGKGRNGSILILCNRVDRTFKMYYGGAQKRPDAPYARSICGPDGKVS